METIMGFLSDANTSVVTLYGQAGFGKSEIALHIGHKMTEREADVYYIKVEDYSDVAKLEERLMTISKAAFSPPKLETWAKNLNKRTLLILDNVDGSHWVEMKSRQVFKTDFVDVLLEHSTLLQVLITSQENLLSKHKFRSFKLHSLSIDSCVLLVSGMAPQPQDPSDSKKLCTLVGNVPMAIKVLTAILSPDYSLKYIIRRLNETMSSKKLRFLADTGDRVDKDRLISAIELAFDFVKPEHQVCGLLLVKFPGSFTLGLVEPIVTSDIMMENSGFQDFFIEECLYELSSKSFLEQITFQSLLKGEEKERYHFHVLIRDFLNTSNAQSKHDMIELRKAFWKNYLDWLSSDPGETWLFNDVSKEDFDALTQILDQNDAYSYSLATSLSSNRMFVSVILGTLDTPVWLSSWNRHSGRLHYQNLLKTAANILVHDCEIPGLNYPMSSIFKVITAYIVSFEEIVCKDAAQLGECMDKLILCQPKVEQLHLAARGDRKAMEASSQFHNNLVELKCLETHSTHEVCAAAWKYRLLGLAHMLTSVRNECLKHCEKESGELVSKGCSSSLNTSTMVGLEMFSLMEDSKALRHLRLALQDGSSSSCKELHDSIMHIALYAIHSRQGNHQGMEESIAGILNIDFQHSNLTCYTAIYGDTVIPFLTAVNETTLAKKLRSMRVDSILEEVSKCNDPPLQLSCQSENRYKTPILNTLLAFSELWVKDMLEADMSLFCSITKEVMMGCGSPYPYIGAILGMQMSMNEVLHDFIDEHKLTSQENNYFLD